MTPLLGGGDAALAAHVSRSLSSFRSEAGAEFGAALDAFSAHRGLDFEKAPLVNFTRIAQPVVHLPVWAASAVARRAPGASEVEASAFDAALARAVDAAVFGYLCAQVQDDGIEGRLGPTGPWVFLAHALFARHHVSMVAVACAPGAPASGALWERYAERWASFARGAARLSIPGKRAENGDVSVLETSGPMLLPAAALFVRAGHSDLLPQLEALVARSTQAAQLIDDLIDAPEDLARGRMTSVVRRFGGEESVSRLRHTLYFGGGFDQVLDEAQALLSNAEALAEALSLEGAAQWLQASAEQAETIRRNYAEALQKSIFGNLGVP